MFTLDDVNLIEGEVTCTEAEYYEAIQRAINSGMWGLQGSYGRTMMDAITSGHCLLGPNSARDYYGNTIPSRDQVLEGTKGSFDYVDTARGSKWAKRMAAVK